MTLCIHTHCNTLILSKTMSTIGTQYEANSSEYLVSVTD